MLNKFTKCVNFIWVSNKIGWLQSKEDDILHRILDYERFKPKASGFVVRSCKFTFWENSVVSLNFPMFSKIFSILNTMPKYCRFAFFTCHPVNHESLEPRINLHIESFILKLQTLPSEFFQHYILKRFYIILIISVFPFSNAQSSPCTIYEFPIRIQIGYITLQFIIKWYAFPNFWFM